MYGPKFNDNTTTLYAYALKQAASLNAGQQGEPVGGRVVWRLRVADAHISIP